jgi:aryl carrier-like protein
MTKKDFQLIADVLRDSRADLPTEDLTDHGLDIIARRFAGRLRASHPRFDTARFLRAAGVED